MGRRRKAEKGLMQVNGRIGGRYRVGKPFVVSVRKNPLPQFDVTGGNPVKKPKPKTAPEDFCNGATSVVCPFCGSVTVRYPSEGVPEWTLPQISATDCPICFRSKLVVLDRVWLWGVAKQYMEKYGNKGVQ